ncbi:2-amino-4-hydroxy-6-hydroxymethyldihydropteridine diphosphokinase [Maritimibacter sp. DP1N21-5]|uniref:2-amino-4-hydroxy-6- hydroxymethyldihydropteridine diphosphokinase n=1 Tax=Maritimibacter sp. DP1N21-5 TaxID=2836867 RepID=UPI001C45C01B|nr:2-amino-4-hydroxy-6-hydroxymethyldihydropteridine diphosphokinase [Maritimibacter sp. DP1N21-5]MBV7408459.1 2-amino-4-hydroxy-6-hydroxymethyldihydropteridine diphosphokinase [Maritimibacter sp. DP1N21-5]
MSQANNTGLPRDNILVCLGSNATSPAGGPEATVRAAISSLDTGPIKVLARSRLYQSPFVPKGTQPDVVNAVVAVETDLDPAALLGCLHDIEASFDRTRRARWENRTLDLDLLTYKEKILPDQSTLREWVELRPELQRQRAPSEPIVPHPRMQDRAFVLVPAADVAPDWRHPLLGASIAEMLAALPPEDVAEIVSLQTT